MNRNVRRVFVLLNLVSLALIPAVFLRLQAQYSVMLLIAQIAVTLLCLGTCIPLYGSSGIWKLTHCRSDALDERQLKVVHQAMQLSYAIFTVVALLLIYAAVLVSSRVMHAITAASLLYLAHTLPGAILAWSQKEI
jgi:uncharacterized Tic20 family protein